MWPVSELAAPGARAAGPVRSIVRLVVAAWLAFGLAAAPAPAGAQAAALAALQITLWPEFDEPSVLVMLDGQLAAGAELPIQLSIRIPAAAGVPHAVAVAGGTGDLLNTPYTTRPDGDDILVEFVADASAFRVEYYDPGLTIQGEARQYSFNWLSDYAVQSVSLRVQQPYDASALMTVPPLDSLGTASYGLTQYGASLGALAAGERVQLHLSYAKPSAVLSAEALGLASGAAAPASAAARPAQLGGAWLLAAAALAAATIGAGALWYTRSARKPKPARSRNQRRHAGRKGDARPRPAPTRAGRFCTQCGQPAQAGDQFCAYCGARLS
jgi:hypothetical protein